MTGLEPATSGVTGRCSNQLSYIPKRDGASSYVDSLGPGISRNSTVPRVLIADCLPTPQGDTIVFATVRCFKGSPRTGSTPEAIVPMVESAALLGVRNLSRFLRHALQLLIK
jgi:hypothetical protein